ncbi:MAG: hypothetical protein E7442_05240 [Ruminococcaceae bacterium]|nr:hypothetical protein [Oscillospiraceae bacterium]
MSEILGIDLGSTMTRAAVCADDGPRLLASLPSVVAFPKKGDPITGEVARRQAYINPSRSCTAILDSIAGIQRKEVDGHFYSGVEIAGVLLRELRAIAQATLGRELRRCVFSVPDAFGWAERRALREAAALAGFHVEGFVTESCASALAGGMLTAEGGRVLICDAGGGSFKASVLENGEGHVKRLACVTSRDSGASHFDHCIAVWMLERFLAEYGVDLSQDANATQRIMEAAELAKCQLSENSITTISIPYITAEKDEPLHLEYQISRSLFYDLSAQLIREIGITVERALEEGGGAERTLICGGAAAMPALRQTIGRSACIPKGGETLCAAGAALAARYNYAAE